MELLVFNFVEVQLYWVNTDKTYSKIIHIVFIITDLPKKGLYLRGETTLVSHDNFERRIKIFETFKVTIKSEFKNIGIDCECLVLTGLELDDSELKNRITLFSPDAIFILIVSLYDWIVVTACGHLNITFLLLIYLWGKNSGGPILKSIPPFHRV